MAKHTLKNKIREAIKDFNEAIFFSDIKAGSLKSDVGTVRAMFNSKSMECSK